MTQEQHDRLDKYEKSLYTAYYLDYLRNLGQTAVKDLDIIYEELFNEKSQLKGGCPYCVLQGVKRIAREYYGFQVQKEPEPENVNGSKSTRKRTTKKNKDTNKE